MNKAASKLASVAAAAGHLAFFVFMILGILIIIFLPTVGFDLPSVPPLADRIAGSVFYGLLAAVGGICGFLITCAIINSGYRRLTGLPPDKTHARIPIMTLLWWCWVAILCWAVFIGCGKVMIDVWMVTN